MSEPAQHGRDGAHPGPLSSRDGIVRDEGERSVEAPGRAAPGPCGWCGRRLRHGEVAGRKRRYCGQSCRQRAYERRAAVRRGGLPEDAVVFSADELTAVQDRLFQVRCAAEDIVTAAEEHADTDTLRRLAAELAQAARDLERLR